MLVPQLSLCSYWHVYVPFIYITDSFGAAMGNLYRMCAKGSRYEIFVNFANDVKLVNIYFTNISHQCASLVRTVLSDRHAKNNWALLQASRRTWHQQLKSSTRGSCSGSLEGNGASITAVLSERSAAPCGALCISHDLRKFMDNAFAVALSPNHCHRCACARSPLPACQSIEGRLLC